MILDRPDGTALLEEARRTLLEVLLPLLPSERRYDALMVANAMAIAGREAEEERAAAHDLLNELAALTGATAQAGPSESERTRLFIELEGQLARHIRSGNFDAPGPRREAARWYLRNATMMRLRISNPKALPR